jgi:hypothetical protein
MELRRRPFYRHLDAHMFTSVSNVGLGGAGSPGLRV